MKDTDQEINRTYDDWQRLMHDMNNHLLCLKGLAALHDCHGVQDYLETLTDQLRQTAHQRYTGAVVADILLNEKLALANEKNIECDIYTDGSDLTFIEDFDLTVILGNLLDNALESSAISHDKSLIVDIYTDRQIQLVIRVANSCDQAPQWQQEQLLTTKADKNHHGLGLKNVRRALKAYNATLTQQYFTEEKTFQTTVIFPLKTAHSKRI